MKILPDFFDPALILGPSLIEGIGKIPHSLQDNYGRVLSSAGTLDSDAKTSDIFFEQVPLLKLTASDAHLSMLTDILNAQLKHQQQSLAVRVELSRAQILAGDLDRILKSSEFNLPVEDQLKLFLEYLRNHLWVERASVFGILDGYTLDGLAGLGGTVASDWRITFSSIAGIAATSRKPYVSEDTSRDPNFKSKTPGDVPRNLISWPVIHGETLLGVLNVSNKVTGAFTSDDMIIIERFVRVLAHLLQKNYFKTQMETYEKTSDQLGKYLSSKVVKQVSKSEEKQELGGIEKKVVCLFSDIRGYTTITEGISASLLVQLLNIYFDSMTAVIEKNEGTVDKIVGDLIMAVWNIPNDQPEPELLAMMAAISMQKEMVRTVAPAWAKHGVAKVGIGIGVNSGLAVVGNLGSKRFMNYTCIGDSINTSQRLEAKARAGEIWMAEHLFEYVNGKIEKPQRKETDIKLKGKDAAISAYVYHPLSI